MEGLDSDNDSYDQKKSCSLETCSAASVSFDTLLPLGTMGSLEGGLGFSLDGDGSASSEFGEEVDARRATRETRAGV